MGGFNNVMDLATQDLRANSPQLQLNQIAFTALSQVGPPLPDAQQQNPVFPNRKAPCHASPDKAQEVKRGHRWCHHLLRPPTPLPPHHTLQLNAPPV